jgi:hypothetical protein
VRLSLARLQSDGYIIVKPNNRYTSVTICKFDDYVGQFKGKRTTDVQPINNGRTADKQPINNDCTADKQPADSKRTQYKNNKNNIDVGVNARASSYACEGEEKKEVFKGDDENSASPTKTKGGAPVKYLKVESVAEYLRNTSDWWKEKTRMTLGLPPDADLNRYIDMFAAELVAQGVTEKKKDEICRHFVNMTRIKIANEPKQQQNGAKREDGYKFGLQDVAGIVQAGMSLGAQDARKRSGEE